MPVPRQQVGALWDFWRRRRADGSAAGRGILPGRSSDRRV